MVSENINWKDRTWAFSNIVVLPYAGSSAQSPEKIGLIGGPVWPPNDRPNSVRHNRRSEVVDVVPIQNEFQELKSLEGKWLWGGPLSQHFGHQMAEHMHRIGPKFNDESFGLLFSANLRNGGAQSTRVPNFVYQALEYLGHEKTEIRVIFEPTIVESLTVRSQGDNLGGTLDSSYRKLLLDHQELNIPKKNYLESKVFVSKLGLRSNVIGSRAVAAAFNRSGFKVIHPESLPYIEQLQFYAHAEQIVFIESSSIHGAELLGEIDSTFMIARRRAPLYNVLEKSLKKRSIKCEVLETIREVFDLPGYSQHQAPALLDAKAFKIGLAKNGLNQVADEFNERDYLLDSLTDLRILMLQISKQIHNAEELKRIDNAEQLMAKRKFLDTWIQKLETEYANTH
jgi:hypothetical protein